MQYRSLHITSTLCRIFTVLLLCSSILPSCKNDPEVIRALTGKHNAQEDRAHGVTFLYSQDGNMKMRIYAREFVRNNNVKRPYIDMNDHLKMEFFDDSGEITDVLTADSSRYYELQHDFIVWDSVQIISRKGEKLNTEELIWNEEAQKFFTEKPVRITTPNEILFGDGMEANQDFTWYRILHPKGSVQVDKGEVPE
jgi:LPS export ABC transporter protein LptC